MSDHELLALAAQAHGNLRHVEGFGWIHDLGDGRNGAWWRPLEDDGDALRLAVRLRLSISMLLEEVYVERVFTCDVPGFESGFNPTGAVLSIGSKEAAAASVRRAIVGAAAGKRGEPCAQAAPQDNISVLEAWEAIGHDGGCNPSKDELLSSLRYMAELATKQVTPQPEQNGLDRWSPLTAPGQIKAGDWLSFTVAGEFKCAKVKKVLHGGTDREEIIWNRRRNYYFVTRMALDGTSTHKRVMIAALAA